MIVIDASVLAVALADDDKDGDAARARLMTEHSLHAPELLDVEVASVWRRQVHNGELPERRARLAMVDLDELPVHRYPHREMVGAAWLLRDNLTIYDALYVVLADLLGCTLLTGDRRLARAPALPCTVEVFSPDSRGEK